MIADLKSNDPHVLYAASAILLAALSPEPEPSDRAKEIVRRGIARVKMQGWEFHRRNILQQIREKSGTALIAELNKAAHELKAARLELGLVEVERPAYTRKPVLQAAYKPPADFDAEQAVNSFEDDMEF